MELKGSHKFAVAPQAVWNALHDSSVLKKCVPGVEEVAWQGEDAIAVKVGSIGPLKGPYAGQAQVVEHTAPSHLKVAVNRASVSGSVTVDLTPDGAGTLLTYNASGNVSGPLAIVDNPLTRPLVDGQINGFFSRLESQIS